MSTNPAFSFFGHRSYFLALVPFTSAMLARIFPALGLPSITKFLHFALTLICFLLILPNINFQRTKIFLYNLLLLLWAIAISALLNSAGPLNVLLDFLILSEPFLLLILIINEGMSRQSVRQWQFFLIALLLLHGLMAYHQFIAIGFSNPDLVKGLFVQQGAGHHVAGAIALTATVYFWAQFDMASFLVRLLICLPLAGVVVISDSKQVVVVFLLSLGAIVLLSQRDYRVALRYSALILAAIVLFFVLANTIFPALLIGTQADRIATGVQVKASIFPLIISTYASPLNWAFGLGPGHTIGRLAELLPDYYKDLEAFGATISPITQSAVRLRESHYLSQMEAGSKGGSSLWSPFFSWAGNWGDLGIIGCGIYLSLWILVYRRFCVDDVSRFFLLNVLIFGLVFGWIEEPGYILFVVTIIGINWQDQRSREHQ